jgi:hypothetical protein
LKLAKGFCSSDYVDAAGLKRKVTISIAVMACSGLSLLTTACSSRSSDDVVAKIGESELGQKELSYATSGMNAQDSAVVASLYVEDWKKTASLYEYAMKEQPELDTLTEILIEKSRRQIVVQRFIDRQLEEATKRGDFKIDSAEVKAFYDNHEKAFSFGEQSYRVLCLFTTSADSAEKFRAMLGSKKTALQDLKKTVSSMAPEYRAENLKSIEASRLFIPDSRIHLETESMSELLRKMSPSSVSTVIKLSDKRYTVMRLEEVAQKGDKKTLAQAYEEISYTLRLRKEKAFYEELRARALKLAQG